MAFITKKKKCTFLYSVNRLRDDLIKVIICYNIEQEEVDIAGISKYCNHNRSSML